MEYEIGDDPQGVPELAEGDRDGGLREGRIAVRGKTPVAPRDLHDDAVEEVSPIRQFGELV